MDWKVDRKESDLSSVRLSLSCCFVAPLLIDTSIVWI